MIPILLTLLVGAFAPDKSVTSLAVQPASDRTEVVVRVDGNVTWRHFALHNPERVVVDLAGARQGLALEFSDIKRGGVTGMRIGQYSPQVVRVVIDLTQSVKYDIADDNGAIRISFRNPEGSFEAWQTGLSSRGVSAPSAQADAPRPILKASQPVQQRTQPRINVSFESEPIKNVLLTFSEFSGRSIVASPEVETVNVTANVHDQPWDVALDAILAAHGLAARETDSGIIIIEKLESVNARLKSEPQVTQIFYIKYASADTLLETIRPLLTQQGQGTAGTVAVNPTANALLVTDTRAALARIGPLIDQMDVRTPQVTISAKIIFIDRTALEELGFVYDLKDSRGSQLNTIVKGWDDKNGNGIFEPGEETDQNLISLGGNSIAALANATNRVVNPALQLTSTLLLGRHSLISFIDALQSVNLSDIQAAPSITVMNHREARIQVGERTPVRTIDVGSQTGGQQAPRAQVRTENTGVILRVTPHITGNQIMLDLHAERSNIALAPSDLGFTFQTQEAETQVLVDNGETAVIGGLTIIEKTKVRAGVPFLMDLPLLGALFRNTSDRENKRDLLIMVTPHIVREGAQ